MAAMALTSINTGYSREDIDIRADHWDSIREIFDGDTWFDHIKPDEEMLVDLNPQQFTSGECA